MVPPLPVCTTSISIYVLAIGLIRGEIGISYVVIGFRNIDEEIVLVGEWPVSVNQYCEETWVPSTLGSIDNVYYWGYMTRSDPDMDTFSWTKLLLEEGLNKNEFDDPALQHAYASSLGIFNLPEGKSVVEVVAEFLRGVYQYTYAELQRVVGSTELETTPIEFWFTVPAIWTEKATAATVQAAGLAGFGPQENRSRDLVFVVTEPEAAAVAVHVSLTNRSDPAVKVSKNVEQLKAV